MAKSKRVSTSKKQKKPLGFPPIKYKWTGEPLKTAQIRAVTNVIDLPDELQRFLLKTNGGYPDRPYFRYSGCEEDAHLDSFLGIDTRPMHDPRRRADSISVLIKYRDSLPELAIPIAFVNRDDLLLTFEWGPRRGQIWLMIWDPITGAEPRDPESDLRFVANSLTEFLHLLKNPEDEYRPATFALDSPKVRGQQLEKLLKNLGCKKFRYIGVRNSPIPLPPRWQWAKFRGSYGNRPEDIRPASLSLERNGRCSPMFHQRPKGHKMLRVDVTETQRKECLKELGEALGAGAVLLNS